MGRGDQPYRAFFSGVAFDKDYLLREFYYPHVGEENHTNGEKFRFGVFSEGKFSWIPDGWEIKIDPLTQELLSVSPLTWSHGTFIATVQQHLRAIANS